MGGVVVDAPRSPHPQAARWWAGTRVDAVLAGAMAVVSVGLALAVPAEPSVRAAGRRHARRRRGRADGAGVAADGTLVAQAGTAWPSSRRRPPVHRSTSSPGRPGSPCSAASPSGRPTPGGGASIAGLGAAGYVAFDRGDPLADLPSIVLSFLVATVAGALSRRRTRAVAAEAAARPRAAGRPWRPSAC